MANVIWNASRPTGYGAVPEYRPTPLADNGDIAAACAWRGRWPDLSGMYWLGARYYDPIAGRFISCDPLGHDADPSLYGFAGGDPINYFDPDGRLAQKLLKDQTVGRFYEAVGAVQSLWNSAVGLYNTAVHPIQTVQNIWNAATHPVLTYDAITDSLGDSIYRYGESAAGLGDDPNYHHKVNGAIKLEIATAVLTAGFSQVDRAGDVAKITRRIDAASDALPVWESTQ